MKVKEKKNILPGAAAAAFVAAVMVYIILLNVEANILRSYEKGEILLAQSNIAAGTVFTEENLGQYFTAAQLDKTMIPAAAVADREQLAGKMAVAAIDEGSVLTAAMLEDWDEILAKMNHPVLAGFRAEDLYQVVSGTLRTGDYIHIYIVDEESEEARLNWENVLVAQVFDSSGKVIYAEETESPAARVNILLEREAVEVFYSELEKGSLRAVKVMEK